MMASISTRSKKQICVGLWGLFFRIRICLPNTVMENIRYGKLDATDEEVIAAAKLANADGFIRQTAGWLSDDTDWMTVPI